MRLLEASVRGFGKLVEREFRFAPGAQLIVGDNEAGKSTLQRFVLAMLFGLKREGRRRREYLAQYELYRPWDGASYAGRLVYELGSGERFEVVRVFDRREESVRILDALSGRDLSAEFALDARKERPFMQKQLQLTRQLFEATAAVGQLAGRPTTEGVGALRERIQGLLDSGDEDFSARRALAHLAVLREQAGSERTPSRGIGLLLERRRLLQLELDSARRRRAEIQELHRRRAEVARAHAASEEAWRGCRAAELGRARTELARRLRRAEALARDLEALHARLAGYADVADVDPSEYAPARARAATIATLAVELAEREAKLQVLRERQSTLHGFEDALGAALGRMQRAEFEALLQKAAHLGERIGRVREARARWAQEQRRNRAVVEELARHHGRDWTRDDFMAELARAQALLEAPSDTEPLERAADRSRRGYARAKRRLRSAAALAVLAVACLAALGAWGPWSLGLAGRLAPAVGTTVAALAWLAHGLGGLVLLRDEARAAAAQAERAGAHQRETEAWLHEVLRRNAEADVEALLRARRAYESLRAEAERSAATSSGRELQKLESELSELAGALHHGVGKCDPARLQALQRQPPESVRPLLPYAEEEGGEEPDAADPPELGRLIADLAVLPQLRRAFEWLERVRGARADLESDVERQVGEHAQRLARLEGEKAGLEAILRRNGARDLDDFGARVERRREHEALLAQSLPLEREQAGVLGSEDVVELRARVAALEFGPGAGTPAAPVLAGAVPAAEPAASGGGTDPGTAASAASLEELAGEVERLAAERAQLDERLAARESEGRRAAEVELEIQEVEALLAEERRRADALELATQTLEQLAASLHREVAPRLNERVGEIFARLSIGRHTEVCLDEELTPRIRMDGGGVCGAESLSGGATDQLYFALRVTAGELLARSGERLPLLLDDPFVQYDPERLQAALDLVTELAGEHQILFFTCESAQAQALAQRLQARGVSYDVLQL